MPDTDKLYWVRRIRMIEVEGDYRPLTYPAEQMTEAQFTRADFLQRASGGATACYVVSLSRMPLAPAPPAPHDEAPGPPLVLTKRRVSLRGRAPLSLR